MHPFRCLDDKYKCICVIGAVHFHVDSYTILTCLKKLYEDMKAWLKIKTSIQLSFWITDNCYFYSCKICTRLTNSEINGRLYIYIYKLQIVTTLPFPINYIVTCNDYIEKLMVKSICDIFHMNGSLSCIVSLMTITARDRRS